MTKNVFGSGMTKKSSEMFRMGLKTLRVEKNSFDNGVAKCLGWCGKNTLVVAK